MKPWFPMIAVATLAIGGGAHAAQTGQTTPPAPPAGMTPPPPGGGGMAMKRMDTNGDGRISRAEFDAASAQRFQRMDANGDGVLDQTEMAPRRGMGRGQNPND